MIKPIILILLSFLPTLIFAQSTPSTNSGERPISEVLSAKEFRKGMIRFHQRQYQAAIQIYNQALSLDPLNYQVRQYLGYAYLNAGYTRNAIDEWENLIQLGGGNPQLKSTLNNLYFRLSIDKNYSPIQPYVFSHLYDGIRDGYHKIIRPSFIAYNEQNDHLWVSSAQTKYVVEIDGNGIVIREIGRELSDISRFKNPTGVVLFKDQIYISDYAEDTVYHYTQQGKFIGKFGISGYASSNLSGPMGLAVSDDEYLFVVDNGNDRIQKFTLDGEWIQTIGEGQLNSPTDVVCKDKWIFISDTRHGRVLQFDQFGNFIKEIGTGTFKEPRGLALKNDILYITDAKGGLFLYDIFSKKIEALGVDQNRLQYPFDVCVDQKGLLYETDFNSQNIAVYMPLQFKYNNLGVSVSQIWTREYPHNFIHLRVWDKTGQPVYNLNADNFSIYEEGEFIPKIYVGPPEDFRHRLYLKLIMDHTMPTAPYHPEIREILAALLTPMDKRDWIDTVLVDKSTRSSGKQNANLLQTLNRILESHEQGTVPFHLGESIYNGITGLLNINRNRALILFTSGNIDNHTFEVYNPDILSTYARQNAIPIYVISLSGKNESVFRPLAESTFGEYYSLKEIKKIFNLYTKIRDSKPLEYILSYDGLNLKGLKNFWVHVHLKIKYKEMLGVFDSGYFVPEIILNKDNRIDLKKEFGGKK